MADNAAPKKKSKLKWVLLIFLMLLVIGGGAAAWYFSLGDKIALFKGDSGPKEEPVASTQANTPATTGQTLALPAFTTNLADPLGQRFIRLTVELEVADSKVGDEIGRQNARIRDSVLMLLSSKSYADIATTESKMMLKDEITERLNTILGPGKIHQVFITDMVVQ